MENAELGSRVRAAARMIEEDGWCQGTAYTVSGARCMGGALASAGVIARTDADFADKSPAVRVGDVILEVLAEQFPGDRRWVSAGRVSYVYFNDNERTTAQEVVAVLEKTAAKLEAAG